MIEQSKLAGCPFCGGKAEFERRGNNRVSTIVRCEDCGCCLESPETFNHGSCWNTRALSAPRVEPVASTRVFDTTGTVLTRSCNVFTITCEDGDTANRVADQLRTPPSQPDTGVREALNNALIEERQKRTAKVHINQMVDYLAGFDHATEAALAALPPDAGSQKP